VQDRGEIVPSRSTEQNTGKDHVFIRGIMGDQMKKYERRTIRGK